MCVRSTPVCICSTDNDSVHRRQAAASQAHASQRASNDTDTCTDAQESWRELRPNGKKMTAILVEGAKELEVMDSALKENRTGGLGFPPPPSLTILM